MNGYAFLLLLPALIAGAGMFLAQRGRLRANAAIEQLTRALERPSGSVTLCESCQDRMKAEHPGLIKIVAIVRGSDAQPARVAEGARPKYTTPVLKRLGSVRETSGLGGDDLTGRAKF